MFGGMNPKKMQGMMKKMGISQSELPVNQVIFKTSEGDMVIDNPSVTKINMQGNEMYQVTGDITESGENSEAAFSEEDIEMVASQTGKSIDEAKAALAARQGDIAEAIIMLKE